jgi:hypothetical protein
LKGINKFGPGIVEHGLPIAGQFVPREFDAELFEREFDEFEAREIDELDWFCRNGLLLLNWRGLAKCRKVYAFGQ